MLDESASSEDMQERRGGFKKKPEPKAAIAKSKPQCRKE